MKKALSLLLSIPSIALFGDEGSVARQQNMYQTLIMVGVAVLFFYFLIYRPEKKKRAEMDKMRSEMKVGDTVTSVNLIGTVEKINDDSVIIKTGKSSVEVIKSAITLVRK